MVLGWSVFMPLGIMAARFSGDFGKIGFPAHRALQSLGAFLVIIGFVIAIALTEDYGKGVCGRSVGRSVGSRRSRVWYA